MRTKNDGRKFIIYKTTNLVNGKIYVGKHATFTPYEFDGYYGTSVLLKRAIKKYGKENFERETLFVFDVETDAYEKEAEIVNTAFVEDDDTYNLCGGGAGVGSGKNHPWYNKKLSKETRKKISEARKGIIFSKEHLKNLSIAHKGQKLSKANLKKLIEINTGRIVTKETRQKISKSNMGKKLSVESLEKGSQTRVGVENYVLRVQDIEASEKQYGWKSELGRKWGISSSGACTFINGYLKRKQELNKNEE